MPVAQSTNHYHFHDNRVLPPQVTTYEQSLEERWWYKPEYIFNELNLNSAIASPDHGSEIDLAKNLTKEFLIQGYAYAGGGSPVTRVEVSLDEGGTWVCADITRPFPPNKHGMQWCWIFWSLPISVVKLSASKSIICRAWDNHTNTQPVAITWNLMGMGNNCCFRVNINSRVDEGGRPKLWFEHPTLAGQQKGGWMTKDSGKPVTAGFGNLAKFLEDQEAAEAAKEATEFNRAQAHKAIPRVISNPNTASLQNSTSAKTKGFTMKEVEAHNKEDDCWIVVRDKVYDCTPYMEDHPGGADSILILGGTDATEDFDAIHSKEAQKLLAKYCIGDVIVVPNDEGFDIDSIKPDRPKAGAVTIGGAVVAVDRAVVAPVRFVAVAVPPRVEVALNPRKRLAFSLKSKVQLSHDSFLLVFALQTPSTILGLPTGKHIFLSAHIADELTPDSKKSLVMRRYTPISSDHDAGIVKFVIKAYPPCERFPRGGKMSQHLANMQIGDTIGMRGPVGEFEYLKYGRFKIFDKQYMASKFNMVAGGTGITPCFQVIHEILRNPEEKTQISLIFACNDANSLLCRDTLDQWAKEYPNRFTVTYTLSRPYNDTRVTLAWTGYTGYVSLELFREKLFAPAEDCFILQCGPAIMMEKACLPAFAAMGFDKQNIFTF